MSLVDFIFVDLDRFPDFRSHFYLHNFLLLTFFFFFLYEYIRTIVNIGVVSLYTIV
jgi:hypothetical protein